MVERWRRWRRKMKQSWRWWKRGGWWRRTRRPSFSCEINRGPAFFFLSCFFLAQHGWKVSSPCTGRSGCQTSFLKTSKHCRNQVCDMDMRPQALVIKLSFTVVTTTNINLLGWTTCGCSIDAALQTNGSGPASKEMACS